MPLTNAQSIRNLAREYIPGLIEEGYANTEITNILRREGLSYRNQDMFRDINLYRLENFGATQIKGIGFDTPIPDRLMRDRPNNSGYEYSAVVKYAYIDAGTGIEVQSGTTLYYNEQPSQAQVMADFAIRSESLQNLYSNIEAISEPERVYYYKH